jgi:hypothetical protein
MWHKLRTFRTFWRLLVLLIYCASVILDFTLENNQDVGYRLKLWMFAYGRLVFISYFNLVNKLPLAIQLSSTILF